jgi:signal transduction histidine kinase
MPLCEIKRGLFTAPIHRAELNSIVFNLLTNAVKAVLASKGRDRRILFNGRQENNEVCLIVADNGCGIPKTIAERIFEPFVTRTHISDDEALGQGTGLGLSIVKNIVDAYGGRIEVIRPPSGYSTAFEVRLPAKE